jgi:hypothetical protein
MLGWGCGGLAQASFKYCACTVSLEFKGLWLRVLCTYSSPRQGPRGSWATMGLPSLAPWNLPPVPYPNIEGALPYTQWLPFCIRFILEFGGHSNIAGKSNIHHGRVESGWGIWEMQFFATFPTSKQRSQSPLSPSCVPCSSQYACVSQLDVVGPALE